MEPSSRWRRWLPPAWVTVLSLAIVAPTLLPGFTLTYDMVFTPRQSLLPDSLGLGSSLPRAVPQDAIVALAEVVVPGELLQKAVLLAIPLVAGFGMLRLLKGAPISARLVAATLAVWNPYVAERLVIGHWGLLLAYALAPWALAAALDMRRGRRGAPTVLVLLTAAGSLTPSGSILLLALAIPVAVLPGSAAPMRTKVLTVAGALACALPWLLPALLNPALTGVDPGGARVFALRDEGPGAVLTAVSLGGIWNADVVLPSRSWPVAAVVAVAVLGLGVLGARPLARQVGRGLLTWWAVVAIVGVVAAVASSLATSAWTTLLDVVPGAGVVRDAHKMLAPLALLVAAAAGMGTARLVSRAGDRAVRGALLALIVLVPLAALPDLAWGAAGRLQAVQYPSAWSDVRATLASDPRPGDVAVLPWSAFRQFPWNSERTLLDPAPRWLTRTTVVADSLTVSTADGPTTISGEDPRARALTTALEQNQPLAPVLAAEGIGWVLVELGQRPAVPPGALGGLIQVREGPDLALYAVPGTVVDTPLPAYAPAVILVDALVAVLLVVLALMGARRAVQARRPEERGGTGEPLVR